MKAMVVDIGSNTVKYDVFETSGRTFKNTEYYAKVLGFISYIDKDKNPSWEGISRLCGILNEYRQRAAEIGCDEILVFATASLRRCRDPYEVIEIINKNTGLKPVLFDGKTEAEMSLLGVLATHSETVNGIMADMGGGSTELNVYNNRKSVYLISNPFGALSLKNDFVKNKGGEFGEFASRDELKNIYEYAAATVRNAGVPSMDGEMFIVGGSAKAIGSLLTYHKALEGELTVGDLGYLMEEYSHLTKEKAELLKLLVPSRELLIAPAATAFKAIADVLGINRIKISTGGIREGYLYSRLMKEDCNG